MCRESFRATLLQKLIPPLGTKYQYLTSYKTIQTLAQKICTKDINNDLIEAGESKTGAFAIKNTVSYENFFYKPAKEDSDFWDFVDDSEKERLISFIGSDNCNKIGVVVDDNDNAVHLYG